LPSMLIAMPLSAKCSKIPHTWGLRAMPVAD
jgi:hypothetical protein